MPKYRILPAVLWMSLLLGISSPCPAESPLLFEFLDDLTKPCHCQRDPFEERIETERHDFTQSATTVGRHVIQIESGYTYFYKETGDETESSHTAPETLIRIGLSEDIELRIRWDYAWSFIQDEEDRVDSEDLRYGLKLQMTRQRGGSLLPTSALEIRGTAPTAGETFSTGDAQFSLDYIYQWEIAEGLTVAGSSSFGTNGFGDFGLLPEDAKDDYFNIWAQSAALGMEVTEANTLYTEWYGIFSDGLEEEYSISIFNVGADHYFTNDFVLDVRFGVGLTEDSEDFFTGVGGAYRF